MRRITSGSISFNDDYPPDIIRKNKWKKKTIYQTLIARYNGLRYLSTFEWE